jgi:hypothetical protein
VPGSVHSGEGLGLSIVQRIVEHLGWRMTVHSSQQGCRFSLEWPSDFLTHAYMLGIAHFTAETACSTPRTAASTRTKTGLSRIFHTLIHSRDGFVATFRGEAAFASCCFCTRC